MKAGSYSDILRGHCEIPVEGDVRVGVKRMRFYLDEDIKNVWFHLSIISLASQVHKY